MRIKLGNLSFNARFPIGFDSRKKQGSAAICTRSNASEPMAARGNSPQRPFEFSLEIPSKNRFNDNKINSNPF